MKRLHISHPPSQRIYEEMDEKIMGLSYDPLEKQTNIDSFLWIVEYSYQQSC